MAKPDQKPKSSGHDKPQGKAEDRHDPHDRHDHNEARYQSRPRSTFTLNLGTGYTGRGYYDGPMKTAIKLMETGLRLGSPAPSSDGGGMARLDRFRQGVAKRKLRVDCIAVHWYCSADPRQFEEFLKELNRKYRRPVRVTEFNAQYPGGDRDRFASQGFKICERLKFVERYSYFSARPGAPGSLWKEGGRAELSPLGGIYEAQ